MRHYLIIFLLLLGFEIGAVDMITATVSITNTPSGPANTITVNGSTRTWTNSITSSPSTLIKETNSVPLSATNLLNHLSLYPPVAGQILGQTTESNVYIRALPGRTLTVTIGSDWAYVTYETNTVTTATIVRVPITVEAATNQTNIASYLASALNLSSNAIATNSSALSNYITKGATVGPQFITSEIRASGNINNGTGRLSVSNLLNYGAAIRSEGSGGNSLQLGSNAVASGALSLALGNGASATTNNALALGNSSTASDEASTAVGTLASASANAATAIGGNAEASAPYAIALGQAAQAIGDGAISIGNNGVVAGTNAIQIGGDATAAANQAVAIGYFSEAGYSNAVSIGSYASATAINQIRLGTSTETVSIPGLLAISGTQTNTTFTGTNVFSGRLDFKSTSYSSLADGNNAGVILGTNVFVKLSGATAAQTLCGFAAQVDGSFHVVQVDNPGLSLTIANQSGVDPTAANRILTGSGTDWVITNNPAVFAMIYDGTTSRWRPVSLPKDPSVVNPTGSASALTNIPVAMGESYYISNTLATVSSGAGTWTQVTNVNYSLTSMSTGFSVSTNALIYTNSATIMLHLGATLSYAHNAAGTRLLHFRVYRNGSPVLQSEVLDDCGNGATESTAIHFMDMEAASGTYYQIYMLNEGTGDVTVKTVNLFASGTK